jgi:cation diffusion facilitator family transporter
MHTDDLRDWQHSHAFGQEIRKPGEARTVIVIAITGTMMVVEVVAGIAFGSMALLADGIHMASHAIALGINVFAYVYARRHAHDGRFSFGTGKVNALGGFTGAILLAIFALMMVWESVVRLIVPVQIAFNQAIFVAVLGLVVNGASVLILGHHDHAMHGNDEGHDHHHGPEEGHGHAHHHDHNLRSAYLHVMADALTSLLAIFALLTAKYLGQVWMDPVMGIAGAILVSNWSLGLLRASGGVLLDRQGPDELRDRIRDGIERQGDNRVSDLHLWSIGPGLYAAEIAIVTHAPQSPDHYKCLIPHGTGLAHVTVEVHRCADGGKARETQPAGDVDDR